MATGSIARCSIATVHWTYNKAGRRVSPPGQVLYRIRSMKLALCWPAQFGFRFHGLIGRLRLDAVGETILRLRCSLDLGNLVEKITDLHARQRLKQCRHLSNHRGHVRGDLVDARAATIS